MARRRRGEATSPGAAIMAGLGTLPPRRGRPALVLLVGPPGVGKTTLARALAAATELAVIESDAVRRMMFRRPRYGREESAAVFEAVHEAASKLLAEEVSVLVDATNLIERERAVLYRIADDGGARLVVVRVTAPAAVVRKRLEAGTARGASEAGVEVFERLRRRREPVGRRHYIVDTTRDTGTAVKAIAREIRAR